MDLQGQYSRSREDETEITRRVVDAFAVARFAMDYEEAAKFIHPDGGFIVPANKPISQYGGICRGRANICTMFRQVDAIHAFYNVDLFDTIVSGDRAVIRWRAMQRNRGSGAPISIEYCGVLRQKDGMIVEFVRYSDTAAIEALAQR